MQSFSSSHWIIFSIPPPLSALGHIFDPVWEVTWGSVLRGPVHLLVPVCAVCHRAFPLKDPPSLQPGETNCQNRKCLCVCFTTNMRCNHVYWIKYIVCLSVSIHSCQLFVVLVCIGVGYYVLLFHVKSFLLKFILDIPDWLFLFFLCILLPICFLCALLI